MNAANHQRSPEGSEDDSPSTGGPMVLMVVGTDVRPLDPQITITEDAVDTVVEVPAQTSLGQRIEFRVARHRGIDSGTLTYGDERGVLVDTVDAVQVRVDINGTAVPLVGIQARIWMPADARITREYDVVLGSTSPELGVKLAQAFMKAPENTDHGAWTLEGATEFVAQAVLCAGRATTVQIVESGVIAAETVHGTTEQLNVSNIWQSLQGLGPEASLARLEQFASLTGAGFTKVATDQLMFRLTRGLNPTVSSPEVGDQRLAAHQVGDDLSVMYVQDTPESMRYLDAQEAEALIPDASARLTQAQANMMRALPRIRIVGNGPLFMAVCGGNYEASLPLLPPVIDALQALVSEDLIVGMPTRDLFLIAPNTSECRAQLTTSVQDLHQGSYPVSDGVYRVDTPSNWLERIS
ncbi:MAG: hypothetical protein AAFN74_20430 [Myxococcota bacterium]